MHMDAFENVSYSVLHWGICESMSEWGFAPFYNTNKLSRACSPHNPCALHPAKLHPIITAGARVDKEPVFKSSPSSQLPDSTSDQNWQQGNLGAWKLDNLPSWWWQILQSLHHKSSYKIRKYNIMNEYFVQRIDLPFLLTSESFMNIQDVSDRQCKGPNPAQVG